MTYECLLLLLLSFAGNIITGTDGPVTLVDSCASAELVVRVLLNGRVSPGYASLKHLREVCQKMRLFE